MPEWYLLPFYAMLRAIPQKLLGVMVLFGAIVTLALIPWLDTSKVRSTRFRPMLKQFFWILVVDCILLGYLGSKEPQAVWHLGGIEVSLLWVARIATALLLRLLLGDPADRRHHRKTQAIARQHRQGGARPRRCGAGCGRVRRIGMRIALRLGMTLVAAALC